MASRANVPPFHVMDLLAASAERQRTHGDLVNLLAGQPITREWLMDMTATTYSYSTVSEMSGEMIKTVLEDVADNLFNPDPYYQQGGDMVRCGGIGWTLDVAAPAGSRIGDLTLLRTGQPIEPTRDYTVAGWASVNEGTQGPPIWDVVNGHLARGPVRPQVNQALRLKGV